MHGHVFLIVNERTSVVEQVFIEHASDVRLDGVSVSFIGEPKPGNAYGKCIAVDHNSTRGVVISEETVQCLRG
jgi:hypothetical protein